MREGERGRGGVETRKKSERWRARAGDHIVEKQEDMIWFYACTEASSSGEEIQERSVTARGRKGTFRTVGRIYKVC